MSTNPIHMEFISAVPNSTQKPVKITTLSSYAFDRNVLTPASAFRFTATGVHKADRLAIRSGDTVRLSVSNAGKNTLVATGFVDETDTHGSATTFEYVITGRDTVSQLIDNDAVDSNNKIINFQKATLTVLVNSLIANTRLPPNFLCNQLDKNANFYVSTNNGETKIAVLQRYLAFIDGLVWADNDGTLIVDKPNFTQKIAGTFTVNSKTPNLVNVMEYRVRRNVNQAIRQIVTQLAGTEAASSLTAAETLLSMDPTVSSYSGTKVGRSVSRTFNYAQGTDILNQKLGVGNALLNTHQMSRGYSAREIARENMRILDVEILVDGHFNKAGQLYNVDQVYQVNIEEDNVAEPMYVYNVSYEMTLDHGTTTRMRLCKLNTICAFADTLDRVVSQ